jgi:hypothetical protein
MAMDRLPELSTQRSEKIADRHLERLAVVYVRQSTVQQMMDHRESTDLQYGLVNRATAMGWPEGRVLVGTDRLWIHRHACFLQKAVGLPRWE